MKHKCKPNCFEKKQKCGGFFYFIAPNGEAMFSLPFK